MMENKCKRFLSLLLAFVMVLGMFPAGHAHAEAVVDGNTITMNVGETYTFDNVDGDYSNLTDEKGIVNVDANFEGQMTERVAALDTDGIDSGAKYILVNTRLWKALENTTSGNNRLFCRETVANAPVWIVTSKGGNSYTAQTEGGAYMVIKANQSGTAADEQVLEITKVEGTDTFVLKQNGQYLCDFNNNNGSADYDIGGYSAYNDGGNKWLFYKVSDAQAYSYTLANNGEKVSALESGKQYVFEETTSNKLLSNQWNNKGGGGNGTGAFLKLNGTKDSFTSLNVWTVTSTDSNGIYRVTDANNLHLRVNNGRADVTNEVTDIRINVGSKCQIGQVRGNTTWYLNRWGGTYQNSAAVGGWSDVNDGSSQWNIYEVTKTALGTSDVTIEAAEVGTTDITIGGTTYHIVVEAEVDPDIPEVCEHKNTVLKNAKPATLTEEGYTGDTWCTDCDTEISKGQTIAKLTVKNAQPMMDSWNSGIVSLDDCLYTLSGNEGAYSLSHGGNYYVRPGAHSTTGRPQQNEPFSGLTLEIVGGKLRISAGSNHLHVHLAGTAHTEPGTHPWWNKCSDYHADAGNGSHDFYLLKANENSTFAGVPGYEVVTTLENAVGGSYLIAFTNKTGEWFVMYPSTETVSLAKVVTDAVTHTHEYTVETVTKDPTCAETGLKDLKCSCGHFHAEHKNVEIPATGEHTWEAEGEVTTDPTCTTAGVKTFKCTVEGCEETKTETIPALGHCWDRKDAGYCVTDYHCCKCGVETNPNYNTKVYFDNTETQWETVAAFFSVTNVGGWARSLGEENGIYTFLVHEDAETVEFKNGSSGAETITTRGFEVAEGKTYSVDLVAIYFQENNAWNEIHVECFDTDGDKLGTSVSKTPVDGKHVLYVDKNTDAIIAYFYYEDGSLVYETFEDVEAGKTYFYPECTHSYDNACDTDCNVCGATRDVAHTPANDDGDCTTAIACSVCGQEATAAKSHAWAEEGTYTEPTFEADGYTTYKCTNSGCNKTNVVTHAGSKLVAVAQIGNQKFTSLQAAFDAVQKDDIIELLEDIELDTYLTVDNPGKYCLDLHGHNITRVGGTAIYVNNNDTTLSIEAPFGGKVTGEQAIFAAAGTVKIYRGTFHGTGDAIYAYGTGHIEIYGGTFSAEGPAGTQNVYCVLNVHDGSRATASISVHGAYKPTFIGFNPADNLSEGAGTNFLANPYFYCSRENNGKWTVFERHVEVVDEAKAPTCTETGLTKGEHCSACGKVLVKQDVIPALEHSWNILDYTNNGANHTVNYVCNNDASHTKSETEDHNFTNGNCACGEEAPVTYVAEINGEKYETLAAALNAAQSGGTVKLLADSEFEGTVPVSATLDLNGHKLIFNDPVNLMGAGRISINGGTIVVKQGEEEIEMFGPNALMVKTNDGVLLMTGDGITMIEGTFNLDWPIGTMTVAGTAKLVVESSDTTFIYISLDSTTASIEGPEGLNVTTTQDGYEVVYKNGTYTLVEKAVAKIGEQGYATLAAALNAAQSGDIVLLLADCAFEGTVPVGATLDLNEHNLFLSPDPLTGRISLNGGAIVFANESGNTELIGPNSDGIKTTDGILIISDTDTIFIDGNFTVVRLDFMLTVAGTARVVVESSEIDEFNVSLDSTEASIVGPDGLNITTTQDGYEVVYENGTYTLVAKAPVVTNVAMIGEQGYATLSAAITAANAGDTITFLADITENVTISKSVTIDGAGKTYTGTMKLTEKTDTTIKNVNFVKGSIDANTSASGRMLTIKDCNFDGVDKTIGYAMTVRHGKSVVIENSTAKNYSTGMLYIPQAVESITVKNVVVENVAAAFNVTYCNSGTFENVKVSNATYGIHSPNYGNRTFTLTDCEFDCKSPVYVPKKGTATVTFVFEGDNTFVTETAYTSLYTAFVLNDGAVLTAPELFDVALISGVENHEVVYENGTYKLAEKKVAVAMIGEQGYETLAAAIAAAKTGDTITFVADITENVTINKSVTIDGAGKTYTGTMTGNKGLTITIENVNFVNGGFDKPKAQNSTTGNYTIKNCTFVDDGNFGYAVRIYGANKLVVEDCTVSGYKWSFLYVVKGTNTVSVKNVTVENCPNYAVYFASGVNNATFENLTVKNSDNGFVINNSTNRSFTIKDCKMENVVTAIDHTGGTKAITCTAQGNNDFGTAVLSEYAKVVLTENATLTAPEGLNVTTNAGDGYKVIYEEGVYKVVYAPAAMIGTKGYATLGEAFAAAQDGDTIVVMKNIDLAKETPVLLDGSYNTYFKVEGKNVTIDMNGMTISGTYTDSGKMLVGVFSTDNGGHLTVTGNGTVNVTATAKVYCLFANYEPGCSITIENGAYTLDKASDSLLYSGCNTAENEGITVNGGTFILGNVGTGTNGKPWIINCLGGNDNATVVNGGTFNSDISHQFWANEVSIPADLALKNNGDGTWTFVEAVACAEEKATSTGAAVRKVGYATLQEAIDAAANGKTVTLLKDIELGADDVKAIPGNLTAMINVAGKSLTLDMNGKTITAAYDASELLYTVIYVGDGASLTVKGEGKIDLITGDTKAGKYDCVAYMFLKSGDTGALNIENGTFTANKVEDSMVYTNGDKVVNIKGGNWTLGNVGTKTNGAPWIFNTKGQNERTILVSGGTYNFNVAKQYYACEVSIVDANGNLSYAVDNGNGTWTVTGQTAEVGIVTPTWRTNYLLGYATFKDAVASIAKGAAETTIVLQKDITVKGQFIGHSYAQKVVIDLNGYTMSSTDKTLTVYRAGTEVTIKNGTVHGNTTGGTIQVTYGGKLTLGENVTIKSGGSATALKVDANSTLIVDQDTTYVLGGKNDLVVADGAKVQISAGYFKKPVQQAWCAEGYVPTDKLENGYYSVMEDPSIGMEAKIGDTYFESLQAAIEAAQDGDVIVVVNDITVDTTAAVMNSGEYAAIYNVAEKAITIDLNGKKIEVTANAADLESYKSGILLGVFCVDNNGELTLTGNGTVTANAVDASLTSDDSHLYSLMVAYGAGSKLTVENGTFHANSVSSALVYSQYDEIVTINGGTYTLGNLGTDSNGSPWLFNAKGQNERNILVNGGTFSADIQHQYYPFEVQMVKELALSKGEDGMYTVVPAVAYVNEQEWSSAWYTNYVGYATVEEAMAASEGVKTVVSGKKTYTSEQENVYVLASELGDVVIPAEFTGSLVLDNCTVKSITNNSATAKIVVNGNVVVENDNGSAITGEIVNISGTGTLTAIANGEHAYGIGGDATKSITIENVRILDVKGGYVQPDFVYDTKYGKSEPEGGAAIGSGFDGAVITLTNVTIDNAQGGSKAAGIGARYHTGVVINITDCTIKNVEGGNASAGIGGSRVSSGRGESGTTINILNSTITAKGGQAGAGIGSGYDTHCQAGQPICTINIDGSTINAVGGKYAAGVGTGYHNAGLAGEIKNSTVNAASGEKFYKDTYTQAMDIGFGVVDPAREARENNSSITFNGEVIAIPAM